MRAAAKRPGPAVGTLLAGVYRLDAVLGRGGTSTVYRAHNTATGSDVALKLLGDKVADDPDGQARFRREVEILHALSHPAIPRFQGFGLSEAGPFLATDIIEGTDLHTEIRDRGARPFLRAAEVIAVVGDALAAAHERGIVHADVKAPNILLGRDGKVYLVDFGIAQVTGSDAADNLFGTPEYMAPEQFAGRPVDARTDIYSLGVVLFEAVTGSLPFRDELPSELGRKHGEEAPPAPSLYRPDAPPWLERVILRCLQKDPDARFLAMRDVVDELRLRRDAPPRTDVLASGDVAVRDERVRSGFALQLECARERTGWQEGMPLRFGEVLYRLDHVAPPAVDGGRVRYRFSFWPEAHAIRPSDIVDYQRDTDLRRMERTRLSFAARLSEWLGR